MLRLLGGGVLDDEGITKKNLLDFKFDFLYSGCVLGQEEEGAVVVCACLIYR